MKSTSMRWSVARRPACSVQLLIASLILFWAVLMPKPAGASQEPLNGVTSQPYTVVAGDQLEISVLGHSELSEEITVLPDGTFTYPIVGTVRAAGQTIDALTQTLVRGLSVQLNQPQVTVAVAQRQVNQVSVLGAVKAPGKVNLKDGWRVLDAIAACGGLDAAGPQYVTITLIQDGKMLPLDPVTLMGGTDPTQNLPLGSDDVILVQARDPQHVDVEVLGEVAKPGFAAVPEDGSITTVLVEVGGPTDKAALSQAVIKRDGKTIPVDLRSFVANGEVSGAPMLQAGDTLIIPRDEKLYAVFGAVAEPGYRTYPDDQPLTVLKALSAAGSGASNANLSNVTILRPVDAKDKQVTTIAVNLNDVLKHGDVAKDVPIEPGDVIYVPAHGQHMSPGEMLQFLNPLAWIATAAKL